jgi:hypothetical protein
MCASLRERIIKFQIFFLQPAIAFDRVSLLIAEPVPSIVHGCYRVGPFGRRRSGNTDANLVSRTKLCGLAMINNVGLAWNDLLTVAYLLI